jgi:hypothetical protein
MQKYCDIQKENVFEIMPLTFYVEISEITLLKESNYNETIKHF